MRSYFRTIFEMIAGLGVLLSFSGPVAATPLESGTAHFESFLGDFLRTASARLEGPEGFLSFRVRDEPLRGGVSSNCFFVDCSTDQVIE